MGFSPGPKGRPSRRPRLYPPAPHGARETFRFWDARTGTLSIVEAPDESAARAKLAGWGADYGLPLAYPEP